MIEVVSMEDMYLLKNISFDVDVAANRSAYVRARDTKHKKNLMYFPQKHKKNDISYDGTDIIIDVFFFHR